MAPDIVDVSSYVERKAEKEKTKIRSGNLWKGYGRMDKYYGQYGGQFVSETLMNTLAELEQAFEEAIGDPAFLREYEYYLKEYVGRETPLYFAQRLTEKIRTQNIPEAGRSEPYGEHTRSTM